MPSLQYLFEQVDKMGQGVTAMHDWFVAEQLQEEAEARFMLKRLRLLLLCPDWLI